MTSKMVTKFILIFQYIITPVFLIYNINFKDNNTLHFQHVQSARRCPHIPRSTFGSCRRRSSL